MNRIFIEWTIPNEPGWQDMDTAPKDREIIGCFKDMGEFVKLRVKWVKHRGWLETDPNHQRDDRGKLYYHRFDTFDCWQEVETQSTEQTPKESK